MLAANKAVVKPKIVLLGQKDPAEQIELDPGEGPFESWLAVAQDMWGEGNLTAVDRVFASAAIGALAVTNKAIFGVVCYHLGYRLFCYSREIDIWVDAYECEPAVSTIQKRPKDKVKLSVWNTNKRQLGTSRFTKLAVLCPSKISGSSVALSRDYASSLKPGGNLFLADIFARDNKAEAPSKALLGDLKLQSLADYQNALSQTEDTKGAIRKGLYNSIGMLTNIRELREPWRGQRLAAYYRELEFLSRLYQDLESGDVAANGIFAMKP
jgi:hypothetical protein